MKKLFGGLAVASLLAIGAGVGVAVNANAPVEAKALNNVTIYLSGYDFKAPYAHYWQAANTSISTTFPGMAMTKVSDKLFSISVDRDTYDSIIFSDNGSNQTGDLTISFDHPYYHIGGLWADAVVTEGYYFTGAFANWDITPAQAMEAGKNDKCALASKVALTDGEVKALKYTTSGTTWYRASEKQEWAPVSLPTDGDNVWRDGTYNSVGVYLQGGNTWKADVRIDIGDGDWATYQFTNACSLSAKIDTDTIEMKANVNDFNEYVASFSDVANGSPLSFIKSDSTPATYTENSDKSNNLRGGNIIVGGDVDVWYKKYDDNVVWASGYANLSGFAKGFLDDTISGSTCADPSVTIKEGSTSVWNYYKGWVLNSYEQGVFNSLVSSADPTAASFDDDVAEAAARYAWLLEKYPSLSDYSGISRPSSRIVDYVLSNQASANVPLIAISAITIAAIGLCGFFVLRKKKER